MYCGNCGAKIDPEQAFCASCGQPTCSPGAVAASPSAVAANPSAGPVTFELTAGALPLFGWILLVGICTVLIVPATYVSVSFFRWFYERIIPSDGRFFEFKGEPKDIWLYTTAYGVLFWAAILPEIILENDEILSALISLAHLFASIVLFRWSIRLLSFWSYRDNERLSFTGSLLGISGWTLLSYAGFLTIIGWGWVYEFYARGLARHVKGLQGQLNFVGKGHQILWRGFGVMLFCIPLLTIPWAVRWLYSWLIEQFQIEQSSTAS